MFKSPIAVLSMITVSIALSYGVTAARAGSDVTEDQIIKALTPGKTPPLTRGLSVGPPTSPALNAEQSTFMQSIRDRTTRSLSSSEREEIATMVQDRPKIDLEINFDYASADISARSLPSVQALGRALTSPDLKGSTFVVAGHTDAAGGTDYNQGLSERRADTIKHYLVDKYGISGTDLVTVGYGKSKLKDPSRPLADVNRRVQVVNMAGKAATSP